MERRKTEKEVRLFSRTVKHSSKILACTVEALLPGRCSSFCRSTSARSSARFFNLLAPRARHPGPGWLCFSPLPSPSALSFLLEHPSLSLLPPDLPPLPASHSCNPGSASFCFLRRSPGLSGAKGLTPKNLSSAKRDHACSLGSGARFPWKDE